MMVSQIFLSTQTASELFSRTDPIEHSYNKRRTIHRQPLDIFSDRIKTITSHFPALNLSIYTIR